MGRPSSSLFKTKTCVGRCLARYSGGKVHKRVNEKKGASIKRLKEKTLGCFGFFLLYTLDCMPGLLAGRQSSALLTRLSDNAHPSSVSSFISFFLSTSTLSIQQTFITDTLESLCCFSLLTQKGRSLGSTIKITANKFQGYKETPVFSEMLNSATSQG